MEKERVSLLGPRGASLGLVEIILGQFANILGPQSSSGFGVYANAFRLVDLSVFFCSPAALFAFIDFLRASLSGPQKCREEPKSYYQILPVY